MIGTALGSSQKLEGAAKHLIDGSEKRIWRLSFQYWSPHVIERHSNLAHGRLLVIHNAAGITSSFLTFQCEYGIQAILQIQIQTFLTFYNQCRITATRKRKILPAGN